MSDVSYANFKTLPKFRQFELYLSLRFEYQFDKIDDYFKIKYHDNKTALDRYFDFTVSKTIAYFIMHKSLDFLLFLIELIFTISFLLTPFLVILLIFLEIYA